MAEDRRLTRLTKIALALPEAERETHVAMQKLDVGTVDWEEVRELVTDAYLLTAPKRLAALLTPPAR